MTRKLKTKSAVLKKFAKEHGLKFKDIKLVELKPEDLAGVPRYRNPLYERQADWDDLPHTEWKCEECGAENSCLDADCQYCDGPPLPKELPED